LRFGLNILSKINVIIEIKKKITRENNAVYKILISIMGSWLFGSIISVGIASQLTEP
jgi:hypothetical protein